MGKAHGLWLNRLKLYGSEEGLRVGGGWGHNESIYSSISRNYIKYLSLYQASLTSKILRRYFS